MKLERTQVYSGHKRHLKEMMSERSLPLNSYPMTQSNNRYFERPLKNNQADLSFKGLSFMGAEPEPQKKKKNINPTYVMLGALAAVALATRFMSGYKEIGKFKISELNDFLGKYDNSLKEMSGGLINNLKNSKIAKKMVKVNGDDITLYQKTVPQLIWDGLKYPFTVLPANILNSSVELLGKIKPLKKWSEKTLATDTFKNIRQRSKLDAKVNSLQGLFEAKNKLTARLNKGELTEAQVSSELFQRSVKMFDTMKHGAYDTKHERSLNRLVSGLPPAIFLATDAYNLSRMMDDDDKKADKEKRTRFSQEVIRIVSNAYLTLVTFGALGNLINSSKLGIMGLTGGTVLITEAFSRIANGKHLTRLTPEQARKINEENNAPEKNIKPDTSFKANQDTKPIDKTPKQEPLLSFNTLMKASAFVIAAGYAIKGFRKLPAVENMFKAVQEPFQKLYKKLTVNPDYTMEVDKFNEIIKILEDNGFKDLAKKYKRIGDTIKGSDNLIHLGKKDKKIKPLVNFFIAPFKFAYNTVTLPYRLVNKAVSAITPKKATKVVKSAEEIAKEISKNDVDVLSKTVDSLVKEAKRAGMDSKQFQSFVQDNMLKAFNESSISGVSNAELSNLAKTAASAATLWFLMTDNYNMVMLKSNGNDKEGAETKFKERCVQEVSRLFYQTLLIDLFNSTFRSQYNASLLGMTWITLTNTTLGEILTRKSVGMPVVPHSRSELEAIEKKQDEATGFVKGYYNFMRRLTGKRSISSYRVENKPVPVEKPINFTNSRPVFADLTLKKN
ncbi:hypothetical protein IJZ97_03515 [bacterium]|nr:hypothetical protein [bacterium]